jgi:phage terminase large subunit GpA-like protein
MSIQLQKENNRYKVTIQGNPAWMPEKYKRRPEAVSHMCRITKGERKVFQKRERPKPSEWVEKNRVLSVGPFAGTKWKNATTPYLTDLMDAVYYPCVREVYLCFAPQTGKSSFIDNCTGYEIDCDPGPELYVYPDEATSKENLRDRILPMIQSSSRLRGYLTGMDEDETGTRINLKHMRIYTAWATSATKLANKTIKYLKPDEIDKFPETPNKREGGTIGYLRARVTWYKYSYKMFLSSTPTTETGPIWICLTKEAQVIFDFYAVCPDCGASQRMVFDQIKWPEGERDPIKIEAEDLAWYECVHCKSKWSDSKRDFAVRMGRWRSRTRPPISDLKLPFSQEAERQISEGEKESPGKREENIDIFEYLDLYKPRKIGVHLPSWYSWLVSLSTVAAAFLRGLSDKNELKNFVNKHEAGPWKTYTKEHKEDKIKALRDDRPRGVVPSGGVVACMTAAVDTQELGFWFEIRAWGWGQTQESWQVREGFVDTFEALERVLFDDEYFDADKKKYVVALAVQDAMGHKTAEVYDFSRKNYGRLIALQGRERQTQPHRYANIEFYPGTNKPIPGGVKLLQANVNYYKNLLSSKLDILPGDPGAWHLNAETADEWAKQMCAEHINDETGLWECANNVKNHAWDVSVYNLVAADVLGVKFWRKETAKEETRKKDEGGSLKDEGKRW